MQGPYGGWIHMKWVLHFWMKPQILNYLTVCEQLHFLIMALLIFLTSLYFCSPISVPFFSPWHWIYCKKYRFWLCAVSSAYYLFIVCHKWCSRQAHKMSFTLTCYQCFAAVSWCHWRSSSIVASSLPCALSLLPNVPAISGSVHYHHIVSLQFLAPKICATPWKILFFGCLGHSKPLQ